MPELLSDVTRRITDQTYDVAQRASRHVTPYLPKAAESLVAARERTVKKPVLVLAMDVVNDLVCQNCGGGGKVYIKLTKAGPFQRPQTNQVVTWFDGNGQYGKGWYIVEDTMVFDCPECHGGTK